MLQELMSQEEVRGQTKARKRPIMREHDLTPTEAAGLMAWHLAHGEALGCAEASQLTGRGQENCRRVLARLSRLLYLERSLDDDPIPHWCWERPLGTPLGQLRARPQSTIEAAAALAWLLADGICLTNADATALSGLHGDSARQMLCRLARVLPILFYKGRWMPVDLLEFEEDEP